MRDFIMKFITCFALFFAMQWCSRKNYKRLFAVELSFSAAAHKNYWWSRRSMHHFYLCFCVSRRWRKQTEKFKLTHNVHTYTLQSIFGPAFKWEFQQEWWMNRWSERMRAISQISEIISLHERGKSRITKRRETSRKCDDHWASSLPYTLFRKIPRHRLINGCEDFCSETADAAKREEEKSHYRLKTHRKIAVFWGQRTCKAYEWKITVLVLDFVCC